MDIATAVILIAPTGVIARWSAGTTTGPPAAMSGRITATRGRTMVDGATGIIGGTTAKAAA